MAVSESGRISVSGPEVIETNRGIEEFDSSDRPLVWRTMGGKHRRLLGGADAYADDTFSGFRQTALRLLATAPPLDASVLQNEQARLEDRLTQFGACADARDIWAALGAHVPAKVPDLDYAEFLELADRLQEARHDAR
ncbi:Malonyl-S-ACP:biotin-protein carboxyltransferase MADC [compost metagenome]